MGTYAGIDLHSSNNYIGIMDQDHKRLFSRRLPNSLDKILMVLEPFMKRLAGRPLDYKFLSQPLVLFIKNNHENLVYPACPVKSFVLYLPWVGKPWVSATR